MPIEKTDAHHHLWSLSSPHYPLLTAPAAERMMGNTGGLKHDFGAREFLPLAAAQNVTRSIYIESLYSPPIEETAHVDAFADRHGFPHAIIGRIDLASPQLHHDLDIHMQSPRFRGVRVMVNWDPDPMLCATTDPDIMEGAAWRSGYAELGRRGLSVEVMAMPAQLCALAGLAATFPETSLIVGHTGLPLRRSPAEHILWEEGMAALADLPHVVTKISGLGMVDHGWSVASIAPIVRHAIGLFGPARCMFASNFPVDGLHASYDAIWDAFDAITADDADTDRLMLFRDTARRVYRIE